MDSGDRWVECACGDRHWGGFGAAGLLVVTDDGRVLLQHRAPWSHSGGTWGVPGGARHADESAEEAARRETAEETGLDVGRVRIVGEHVEDHGPWRYTTLVGRVPAAAPVTAERESAELRWVPLEDVLGFPLHPAFAAAWPALLRLLG